MKKPTMKKIAQKKSNLKLLVESIAEGMNDVATRGQGNATQLPSDEKWFIAGFVADVFEDDFKNGEGKHVNSFTDRDTMDKNSLSIGYGSATEALQAICENLYFKYDVSSWVYDSETPGRFVAHFTVDNDNSEATKEEIEKWKVGNLELYLLCLDVELVLRTSRAPTLAECKSVGCDPM